MAPSADQARLLLCELGEFLRDLVVVHRVDIDMATVTGETVADTIYAIDRVADDALVGWFAEHWPQVSDRVRRPGRAGPRRRIDARGR